MIVQDTRKTKYQSMLEALGPLTDKPIYCAQCGALCRASWRPDSPNYDKPGYGYDSRDRDRKKRYCYQCCAVRDARDMQETGAATLYIIKDPVHPERFNTTADGRQVRVCDWFVTNWPGSLKFRCGPVQVGRHNIAGKRYDVWFQAFGSEWHGVTYGDNTQLCHVKRLKSDKRNITVKITRYELWGNAKDGFDTNNFFNVGTSRKWKESEIGRTLTSYIKDCFEGHSFAWTENTSRPMVRDGISIDGNNYMQEGLFDVLYRGHIVGQVEIIKP